MIHDTKRVEMRRLVLGEGWKIGTVARRFGVHLHGGGGIAGAAIETPRFSTIVPTPGSWPHRHARLTGARQADVDVDTTDVILDAPILRLLRPPSR